MVTTFCLANFANVSEKLGGGRREVHVVLGQQRLVVEEKDGLGPGQRDAVDLVVESHGAKAGRQKVGLPRRVADVTLPRVGKRLHHLCVDVLQLPTTAPACCDGRRVVAREGRCHLRVVGVVGWLNLDVYGVAGVRLVEHSGLLDPVVVHRCAVGQQPHIDAGGGRRLGRRCCDRYGDGNRGGGANRKGDRQYSGRPAGRPASIGRCSGHLFSPSCAPLRGADRALMTGFDGGHATSLRDEPSRLTVRREVPNFPLNCYGGNIHRHFLAVKAPGTVYRLRLCVAPLGTCASQGVWSPSALCRWPRRLVDDLGRPLNLKL